MNTRSRSYFQEVCIEILKTKTQPTVYGLLILKTETLQSLLFPHLPNCMLVNHQRFSIISNFLAKYSHSKFSCPKWHACFKQYNRQKVYTPMKQHLLNENAQIIIIVRLLCTICTAHRFHDLTEVRC